MKKQVIFRDADMQRFTVEIEVRDINRELRNYDTLETYTETKEISVTGECGYGAGQCDNQINPRTPGQKALLEFWNTYHLNHMTGGTAKQNEYLHSQQYLDDCKRAEEAAKIYYSQPHISDFDVSDLAYAIGLKWEKQKNQFGKVDNAQLRDYNQRWIELFQPNKEGNVVLKTNDYDVMCAMLVARGIWMDRDYQYGTEWLYSPVPEDIEYMIDDIIENIEYEEEELTEQLEHDAEVGFDMGADDFEATEDIVQQVMERRECDEDEAIAFLVVGQHLKVTFGDLNYDFEYDEDSYHVSAMGYDFYVGDEDDLEKYASDLIHNDSEYEYFWRQAVASESTTQGLEDWLDDVIRIDGWASVLNHYDGNYNTYRVAGNSYAICRE